MGKLTAFSLAISLCMAPSQLAAADFDGSVPLLCAPVDVLECGPEGCLRGSAESVNIPQFFTIDFEKNMISAQRSERTTPIRNVERVNGRMVMQGTQGGRGWSIIISQETGKMSAAVSDDQVGFVVFGACTPF